MPAYGPGQGPGPKPVAEDGLARLLASRPFGVLATNGRSGHPHLSTVVHAWDPETRTVRISTVAGRAKVRQLANDPRAALHVAGDGHMSFAVAEGKAEVSEVSGTPGDAVGRELLAMTPGFDDPADERAFLAQMVADRRMVIRLHVDRLYGTVLAD